MSASKDDEDEEVVFEGTKQVEKKMGEATISATRPIFLKPALPERFRKMNGVPKVPQYSGQSSSSYEDDDDEDEEEEDMSMQIPPFRRKKRVEEVEEPEEDDLLEKIRFQRRDDPRALLTHETMCALRQNIDSMNEFRDPSAKSTTVNGITVPDPIHAMTALDHNLWVLASAASLRLNEVGERCKMIPCHREPKEEQQKHSLAEVLPKALAALSGQQIGFKEKEPEKPEPKGKGKGPAPKAAPAAKPVTRERPVREKAEPKKKTAAQQAKEERLAASVASPRPNTTGVSPRVATPAVNDSAKNGRGAKGKAAANDDGTTTATNTRKRKAAAMKEEKEDKKETKATKAKGGTAAKRTSTRTAKKAKEAVKEDEPTYCHCNRISFGEMVGCDNEKCEIEWFHFECINIKVKPKGKWYCPDCRAEPNNSKQPKKPSK